MARATLPAYKKARGEPWASSCGFPVGLLICRGRDHHVPEVARRRDSQDAVAAGNDTAADAIAVAADSPVDGIAVAAAAGIAAAADASSHCAALMRGFLPCPADARSRYCSAGRG